MAYAKRYPGGFLDKPTLTTPIDSAFLNAVETALLELLSQDGSVDGQVMQWVAANSKFGPALLLNKNIDAAAAIDKSKLNLAGQIADADISGAAAIARSKLNFGAGLVNADLSAVAAIANSKLAIPSGSTVLMDVTLGGSQATIDTNTVLGGNLPTGYSHLKVVILSREDTATANDQVSMRINNDSAANYDYETVRGNGNGSAAMAEGLGATSLAIGLEPGSTVAAGIFGSTELLIPHYNGTVAQKTMTGISSAKSGTATGNLFVQSFAGFWRSTAAITRLTFLPGVGNFIAGTRITIYGMV